MEEKERYIIDRFDDDIFDTKKEYYPSNQTICEIINQQDKRIKELQEENQQLIKALNGEVFINYKLPMENAKLKQQLAEKEKTIETILKENEELVIKHNVYNWGDKIQQDKFYSITGEALELLINIQNQKALEQLEKVKEHNDNLVCDDEDYYNYITAYIDNQINELKGGK